jgi:cytochrome c-type biogenesis protein CcsB
VRNPHGSRERPSPTLTILPAALLVAALGALCAAAVAGIAALAVGRVRESRVEPARATPSGIASVGEAEHGSSSLLPAAHLSALVALGFLLAWLALRTVTAGRAPWSNLHEFSVGFAAAILAAYAVLERRHALRPLVSVVAAVAAGIVGFALTRDSRVDPLVPALQQPVLLTIHVAAAMLAYALGAIAFAAAIGELIGRAGDGRVAELPSPQVCRRAAHRAVLLGFPILTGAIVLGSVWATLAWRAYWSNDPKELAAAATWLVYGAYLHAAGRRDRWGAVAPWLLLLGFGGILFTYIGASLLFVGEHSYAGG